MKRVTALMVILVTALTPTLSLAMDYCGYDKGGAVLADTVLVRPISLAALGVGTALFIVSLPFALLSGSVDTTAEALVAEPFNFTFTRPMGEFYGPGDVTRCDP